MPGKNTDDKRKPRRRFSRKNSRNKRRSDRSNEKEDKSFDITAWQPKTKIGKEVKSGEIKDIEEILDKGIRILEPEIIDILLPDLEKELLLVGQSKGKFGGGQRRVFRQTQKKTREGNKPKFSTFTVAGNKNGFVGIGFGKSKETVPAREKSIRQAKLNMIKIRRACGSWQCACKEAHSIPFTVTGKCGSVIVTLIPAPEGTGLCTEKEIGKILSMAGIKDVWSKTFGKTSSKMNVIYACFDALKNLMSTKIRQEDIEKLGIIEGAMKKVSKEEEVVAAGLDKSKTSIIEKASAEKEDKPNQKIEDKKVSANKNSSSKNISKKSSKEEKEE
jgi:small subunit ribosomal protein S5